MRRSFLTGVAGAALACGCVVDPRCFGAEDCAAPQICRADGRCDYECRTDEDCGGGLVCQQRQCRTWVEILPDAGVSDASPEDAEPLPDAGDAEPDADAEPDVDAEPTDADVPPPTCPEDMVDIGGSFCMDRFEASRRDATSTSSGTEEGPAVSRPGVLPWVFSWETAENTIARDACLAADKDLCTAEQWWVACTGPERTAYGYGDSYDPAACNGIDLFGRSGFHLLPTGALEGCRSAWGVYDLNGNVWEHVLDGSTELVRGGAYNCNDSALLHQCDYVPANWTPSARGFRCCKRLP